MKRCSTSLAIREMWIKVTRCLLQLKKQANGQYQVRIRTPEQQELLVQYGAATL